MDKLLLSHQSPTVSSPPPPSLRPLPPLLVDVGFRWVDTIQDMTDGVWWFPDRFLAWDSAGGASSSPGRTWFQTMRGESLEDAVLTTVVNSEPNPLAFAAAWLDPQQRLSLRACKVFPARDVDPMWLEPGEVTGGMVNRAITAVCRAVAKQQRLADTPAQLF